METVTLTLPELHTAQARVKLEATRWNVVNCGRRWGKTTLGLDVVADGLVPEFGPGLPVGWWSPTYKMLSDVWRELVEMFQPVTVAKSEQEHRLELITGGVLDMWSMDSPDSARGRKYKLAVIDEAAMVPNLVNVFNLVIRPTLVDLVGSAWFLSTPKRGMPDFRTLHQMGRSMGAEWKSWTFTSYDNPYISKSELDDLSNSMTELAYKQEIMAEFLESEGVVFRNLKSACNAPTGDTPIMHRDHVIVAGVDWGKQDDYTAISLGCATCRREVLLERYNQIDYHFQIQRVVETSKAWGLHTGCVELNSIGTPIFEQLQRTGLPFIGFETTGSSKPPLIEALALAFEQATPQFLNVDYATAELEAYENKVNPKTGHSSYSAPDGMHDDTVIARALMLRAMNSVPRQPIHSIPNPWTKRQ